MLRLVQGSEKLTETLCLFDSGYLWKTGTATRPILTMPPEFDRSCAICQLVPVADLLKCFFTLSAALDGWNDWNVWNDIRLKTGAR
jgi:hypothetical protein